MKKHHSYLLLRITLSALLAIFTPFNMAFAVNTGFLDENEILFYDPGDEECAEYTSSISGGVCPELVSFRARLAAEMEADTTNAAKQVFFFRTYKEVGGNIELAWQAFMEEVFNRAESRGHTIFETVNGHITQGVHGNYYPSQIDKNSGKVSDETAAKYEKVLTKVLAGSNLIKYGTGNASGNVGVGYETKQIGEERFGIETNDAKWAKEMKEKCASSTQTTKLTATTTNWYPETKKNMDIIAEYLTTTNFVGNNNQPLNAVQMAAIMGNLADESTFDPKSGVSEDGPYKGLVSWSRTRWSGITEPKTDIYNQLNYLKKELDGGYKDAVGEFWKINSTSRIDEATYLIVRNYEGATENGGGSTTWTSDMNDEIAEANVQGWSDRKNYAREMYNLYGSLAGASPAPSQCNNDLVSGGMNLEQATEFIKNYKNLVPSDWEDGTRHTFTVSGKNFTLFDGGCDYGALANCVTLSQYFINRYTTLDFQDTKAGGAVARYLIDQYDLVDGQGVPRAYAIFSYDTHTGIVLGIDEDNDKIIIGESACYQPLDWTRAYEYSLSDWLNKHKPTFAYTDGILSEGL